jgi:hypothetical protein
MFMRGVTINMDLAAEIYAAGAASDEVTFRRSKETALKFKGQGCTFRHCTFIVDDAEVDYDEFFGIKWPNPSSLDAPAP